MQDIFTNEVQKQTKKTTKNKQKKKTEPSL